MSACTFAVPLKGKKILGTISSLLFLMLSVGVYITDVSSSAISFALGVLACIGVILLIADYEDKLGKSMSLLAKNTMPIFLMHTIFAAPLRAVLLKVGITNAVAHIIMGLGISFLGPVVAAWIVKKTKWLEFFLYPAKFIKMKKYEF